MPFPSLAQPLPVRFLPDPAENIREEFPNRLAVGDNLQRQATSLTSMPLVRQEILLRDFQALARDSGFAIIMRARSSGGARSNPVVATLSGMVDGILSGQSFSPENRSQITRFIANQEERAKIVSHLLLTHDMRRLTQMLESRDMVEAELHEAARRGDLNPSERLAFMAMLTAEIDRTTSRVRAKATNADDIDALIEKADYQLQQDEASLIERHSKNTTPGGREIMRRLGYKLQKLAAARV